MDPLFDKDSPDDDAELKINENYAERYNQWREKEEFQKLCFNVYSYIYVVKDKYGEVSAAELINNIDEDSCSSSETEDEDGEAWTADVEKEFFQTLASLKNKDPSIYTTDKKFFSHKELVPPVKIKKEKAMFLRDYERKNILENNVEAGEEHIPEVKVPTYHEEQEALKKGFQSVMDGSDSDGEDLLVVRKKTDKEKEKEDEDYKEWLKGRKDDINEDVKNQLKPLKEFWSNPKLDENEKFLRDFILNKRYLDSEDKDYIPTYEEVVHDSEGDLSEDEKTLEKQTEFEQKYNFRFEEPDPEFIKRYPRTIADSLRKTDESRKMKREETKERKKKEKETKKEELKQLKKFKLNEIKQKLDQLKAITGNDALPFQDEDLEEDFDPDKYDEKMKKIFDEQYYEFDEGDQKPEFPYDEEIDDENWDNYAGEEAGPSTSGSHYEPHCEDPDFNMDCDYDPNQSTLAEDMVGMSRKGKSRKKSLFAKKLESKKPVFDPKTHPNYEEYLEEYYKLDYEDIIGDLPVRFKYRQVVANDFGLDTEEILMARDKELNRWCSVKKTCQYRDEREEMQDVHTFRTKKDNINLKKKVLPSIFAENSEELLIEDQEVARQKRRKNKGKEDVDAIALEPKGKKLKLEEDTQHGDDETFQVATEEKATISECNQDKVNAEKPIGHNLAKEGNAVKIDGNKKRKKKKKKKAISSSQEKAENVPNIQPAFKKPVNIAVIMAF
nr:EOG090X05XL [Leptodora kindtii]